MSRRQESSLEAVRADDTLKRGLQPRALPPVKHRARAPWWLVPALGLVVMAGVSCAHTKHTVPPPATAPIVSEPAKPATQGVSTNPAAAVPLEEQVRNECINGARFICGRVLSIEKDGLVLESGYTDLNRPPLNRSWVVTGNVTATLEPHAIEANVPGTDCFGTVFLTDIPARPVVHKYDYVLMLAYPAGQYEYVPVAPVKKTIRKFSRTLELAVILRLQDLRAAGK